MPDGAIQDGSSQDRVFGVTASAAKRIAFLKTQEADGDGLRMRVSVLGGGCSGFQYVFDFDRVRNDDDHVFVRDGVEVLVDDVSLDLLAGAQLDYKDELIGAYFAVENPNASSSCGCGTSFSIG
jgi:iron-sulfur cluster insertion protein